MENTPQSELGYARLVRLSRRYQRRSARASNEMSAGLFAAIAADYANLAKAAAARPAPAPPPLSRHWFWAWLVPSQASLFARLFF